MLLRSLVVLCVLFTATAFAAGPKPAAVQVCLKAPAGVELFSTTAKPYFRSISNGVWMLDLDVEIDGVKAERVTRSAPTCVRAWVPAHVVKKIAVTFERVPLNYTVAVREVTISLKPDLWSDGGSVVLEQEPFAVANVRSGGEVKFERVTSNGSVLERSDALPTGRYLVTHVPPAQDTRPCPSKVEVVTMGTVTSAKDPEFVKELALHYQENVLPEALRRRSMVCTAGEEVVAEVLLVDGVFMRPLQPKLTKVIVPVKETTFELSHDGRAIRLDAAPVTIDVAPGQVLEVVAKPPTIATR